MGQDLVESYHSPEVKEFVLTKFKGAVLAELVSHDRPTILERNHVMITRRSFQMLTAGLVLGVGLARRAQADERIVGPSGARAQAGDDLVVLPARMG